MKSLMIAVMACQVTLCHDDPGKGKWLYRIIEGHKCWFQEEGIRRGREKPREELKWPKYGEFDERWNGEVEDKKGWSHQE